MRGAAPGRGVLAALGLVAAGAFLSHARAAGPLPAGEAIYRTGRLPSGNPLSAVVSGDVRLDGLSAACATCHQRSGMGSVEGRVWVPPVAGPHLFSARSSGPRLRPSYDDATLARALRDGLDAAGRPLDPLMPRYDLAPDELEALSLYLHGLGAVESPGVTPDEIRFATVVTPDADPVAVRATRGVLEAFFATKQVQVRAVARFGRRAGTFRRWVLSTWVLEGPPAAWGAQLDALYARTPVFALLSGAGGSEWGPVHDFCERHEVPCLLPNVDVPPDRAATGTQTLYFSAGVRLEAAAMASEIAREPPGTRVVQLHPGGGPGKAGAEALGEALAARGIASSDVEVSASSAAAGPPAPDGPPRRERLVAVSWLTPELARVAAAGGALARRPDRVLVSSSQLGGEVSQAPSFPGAVTELVHPFSRPDEIEERFPRVALWLRTRGVAPVSRRIEDQTFLACTTAGEALMHLYSGFDRAYFVELVDHVGGSQVSSAFHARLSFGPGQRLLERGCYLVDTADPVRARWLAP